MIKVIVKEPHQLCEVREIENSLKSLQKIVGGYIESIQVSGVTDEGDITCYGNDEAKLLNLPSNFALVANGYVTDCVAGTVVFLGHDGEGENIGLTNKQLETVAERVNYLMVIRNKYIGQVEDWSDHMFAEIYSDENEMIKDMVAKGRWKKLRKEDLR